jgi:hypothetical protein
MASKDQIKRAKCSLISLKFGNEEFFKELITVLNKYSDWRFRKGVVSYKYKDFFRIVTERERSTISVDEDIYTEMQKDSAYLENKYFKDYNSLKSILLEHTYMWSGFGYTTFVHTLFDVSLITKLLPTKDIKDDNEIEFTDEQAKLICTLTDELDDILMPKVGERGNKIG